MAVYLITYALKNQHRDYSNLFRAIQSNSTHWWHYLPDIWIINTNKTAEQLARALYPFIEQADYLLVKRLAREH